MFGRLLYLGDYKKPLHMGVAQKDCRGGWQFPKETSLLWLRGCYGHAIQ